MTVKKDRTALAYALLSMGIALLSVYASPVPILAQATAPADPSNLTGPWTVKMMGHTWSVVLSKAEDGDGFRSDERKEGDGPKYCGTGNREKPDDEGKPVDQRICAWFSAGGDKLTVVLGPLTTCESSSGKEPTVTGKCSFGGMFEGRLEATRQIDQKGQPGSSASSEN
jgi:hypothetical protein